MREEALRKHVGPRLPPAIPLLVLTTAGLAGCLGDAAGEAAPAFTLTTLDGRTVTLADYAGRVLVLDMMATWCAPCKEAMPAFRTFLERHDGEPVSLLSVDVDPTEQDAGEDPLPGFRDRFNATWDFAYDTDTVFARYRAHGIPTLVLIDADGIVRGKLQLARVTVEDLEARVTPLVEEAGRDG